VTRLSFPLKDL